MWIQGGVEEVIEMLDGRDTGRAGRDEQRAQRLGEGTGAAQEEEDREKRHREANERHAVTDGDMR